MSNTKEEQAELILDQAAHNLGYSDFYAMIKREQVGIIKPIVISRLVLFSEQQVTAALEDMDKRIAELTGALKGMIAMYTELVNSGDCGFWDPTEVEECKKALFAINNDPFTH